MKNILIVLGHPDQTAPHLCHAIAQAYQTAAEANGHKVTLIALGDEDIPFLRSKTDWTEGELPATAKKGQTAVSAADHIVMIYPLWMGDMPALLKAWVEQVFREGFAFKTDKDGWHAALKGKTARVIVTMGMPGFAYRWFYMAHSLRSLDRNILKFCGIRPVKWSIFGNAEDPAGRAQKAFLQTAKPLGAEAA